MTMESINFRADKKIGLFQCRLCLADLPDLQIPLRSRCASHQDKLVVELITTALRLDIALDNDNLPQYICSQCLSRLDAVYSFLQQASREESGRNSNMEEYCRICRRNEVEELISIFCVSSREEKLIADMLQDVCGMSLPGKNDGLAQYVCGECFSTLSAVYSFRNMVLESHSILNSRINKKQEEMGDKFDCTSITETMIKQSSKAKPTPIGVKNENVDPFIYLDSAEVEGVKPLLFTKEKFEYYDELIFTGVICCCRQLLKNYDEWKLHCREVHFIEMKSTSVGNDCTICHHVFRNTTQLVEHLKSRRKQIFYRCKICNIMTLDRAVLRDHFEFTRFHPILHDSEPARLHFEELVTTNYESSGDCCGCSEQFETGAELLQHAQEMHYSERDDQPSFQCLICYKSFASKQFLYKHQLVYATTKTYRCRKIKCEFKSGLISEIKEHVESDVHFYKPTEFFCCFFGCNESFGTSHALEQHCSDDHTEQRITNGRFSANATSNVCWLCNRHLATSKAFRFHIRGQSDRRYMCSLCGKKFVSQTAVENHEKAAHSKTDLESFPCDRCEATFASKYRLLNHIKTAHDRVRSELCTTCGKGFLTKRALKGHIINRHMEEKPYKCTECSMAFGNKFLLQGHIATHSTERPHTCSYCELTYRRRSDMKRHINAVHLNNKPFACESCDARFIRRRDLQLHTVRHTKTKLFQCSVTGCAFTTNVRKQMDEHSIEDHK